MMGTDNKSYNLHKDFKKVFYRKEGRELRAKGNTNLWVLIGILWITFTAVGFAAGSLDYLGKKMDDAYINWINVTIPFGDSEAGERIRNALNKDTAAKALYHYKVITPYYKFPLAFKSYKAGGTIECMGRSIEIDDPILEDVFLDKNKIFGRPFKDEKDIGIIITTEFIEKYGYENNPTMVYMALSLGDNREYVPIPVIAVLNELPGLTLFATTPYFRNLRKEQSLGNPFRRDWTSELIYFYPSDSSKAFELKNKFESYLNENNQFQELMPWVELTTNNLSYNDGFNINISFLGDLSIEMLDSLSGVILKADELQKYRSEIIRFYDYKTYQVYESYNYDHLAINFEDLSNIRDFKDYFFKTHELQIDIAQIEARENYSYVSNLTLIISMILILFSLLIISMFISNILSRHLDKIRMNIGTFKAFGLNKNDILNIYSTLVFRFVMISLIISFSVSLLIGTVGGVKFGLSFFQKVEDGETYFNLLNYWSLISIILVIVISISVTYITTNKIVRKTPGDLIYER